MHSSAEHHARYPRAVGGARYRRSSSRRTALLHSRFSVSRPRHHHSRASDVTFARRSRQRQNEGLRLILPFDERPPHLDQLQLRLLARSRMLVGTSRLKQCGLGSWTCVHTTRPNPFSSTLSFCAPRARDANPVLPSVREACKGPRSRYRRISSRPPLDAPPTERNDRRAVSRLLMELGLRLAAQAASRKSA
jgi:hypothetical protein